MGKFKTFIGRILPASKTQVNVRCRELDTKVTKLDTKVAKLDTKVAKLDVKIAKLNKKEEKNLMYLADIQNICVGLKTELGSIQEILEKEEAVTRQLPEKVNHMAERIEVVRRETILTKRASKEAVWGEVFRDSINGSKWLKEKCFYPGRWAVGYQYLYVLYRVLNSVRPQSILELGLGQSTSMITQYAASGEDIRHRVVEHDREWIDYYQDEFELSEKTEIVNLDISKILFQDQYELYHYEKFNENLSNMKYDFISVDAPFGGAQNEYSRIDILEIIPECLESSFVIMIDDVDRQGEKNTIQLIQEVLDKNGIAYSTGKYVGDKDTYVIASADKKFVCTL